MIYGGRLKARYAFLWGAVLFIVLWINTLDQDGVEHKSSFLAEMDVPSFPAYDPEKYPPLDHPTLSRMMPPEEYAMLLYMLNAVDALFVKYNVSYFMGYDTLIGSLVYHDVLPWGKDCYLIVNDTSRALLMNMFLWNPRPYFHFGIRALEQGDHLMLYHKNSRPVKPSKKGEDQPIKPFCKVYFIQQRGNVVNVISNSHPLKVRLADVIPLQRRPFGDLWLSSPANPKRLARAFDESNFWSKCLPNSGAYGREDEACAQLHDKYPRVTRRMLEGGIVEETLGFKNGTVYYTVPVFETVSNLLAL